MLLKYTLINLLFTWLIVLFSPSIEPVNVLVLLSIFILTGCTDKDNTNFLVLEENHKNQIDELKKENENIKQQYLEWLSEYNIYLQRVDGPSRRIMRLISEKKFEEIESEYETKLNRSSDVDGNISIITDPEYDLGFPIEQGTFPMSIAYFNVYEHNLEIGYFLDDLKNETRYSITFVYNKEGKFQNIFIGDIYKNIVYQR